MKRAKKLVGITVAAVMAAAALAGCGGPGGSTSGDGGSSAMAHSGAEYPEGIKEKGPQVVGCDQPIDGV